ncbi:MAG: AAA family ATPase [Patescibacteria group bacterium]|nr:AAA family ATPase [Patescibacteria group bacterium]
MNLIVVYGPPASGKLTVSEEISKRTGYKIFHNHVTNDLFTMVMDFSDKDFWNVVGNFRAEIVELGAKNDKSLITTLCYEPEDKWFIEKLKKAVKKYDGNIYFVQLKPSKDVLLKRVTEESRKKFEKIKDPDKLHESLSKYDYYSEIDEPNNFSIDNSNIGASEVADKVINKFELK